jgi:hypothetical protein
MCSQKERIMKRNLFLAATVALVGLTGGAYAQTSEVPSYWQQAEKAPAEAVELTLGTGYTQGFGQIQKGGANNINDVANAGIGVDLGVGYRITPNLGLALAGQYQEFSVAQASSAMSAARGLMAGADATYHFAPFARFSPWMRVGTGYRMLWSVTSGPTVLYHGLDFVRLATGFDIRTTPDFAIGPVIGADLNVYLWQYASVGGNSAITDPRVSTYVYAGLLGRFDVGGTRKSESTTTVAKF